MNFISTRGHAPKLNFEQAVLTGLAEDGGLYVPDELPTFSKQQIADWAGLSYQQLAFNIVQPFVDGEISDEDLHAIIQRAYSQTGEQPVFRHAAMVPLVQIGHNEWIAELFQGPTLAFKDFALQFLGHLLDHVLTKRQQRAVVLGATSGDTGSAAIEACRRCNNLDIFILHPYQRVSDVQRRQMTTVLADNVHNIALKGTFDDCQQMVKTSFADQSFLPDDRQLVAVNSINWARIMAQIVYYFYLALQLGGPHRKVSFSVPTGNFGDIYAGYMAYKMGLPIEQLIIATNQNDIIHRCISANDHSKKELQHTLSPSMDIMVSSNFERLLFDLHGRDGGKIQSLMNDFSAGEMHLEEDVLKQARVLFSSYSMNDQDMLKLISNVYQHSNYLLDPHTAIGVAAARAKRLGQSTPLICLATAHPAKFPDAVLSASTDQWPIAEPKLPNHMAGLFEKEERFTVIENDSQALRTYISKILN